MNPLKHVAIIMDGNGRWGLKNKKSRNAGHRAGLNTVEKIIKETIKNEIKFLSLYAFSSENWKRPKKEINFLFNLLENFLKEKIEDLDKQKIKLKIIGKKSFSTRLNSLLKASERKTSKNKKLQINLALNYGSKAELISAFKELKKNSAGQPMMPTDDVRHMVTKGLHAFHGPHGLTWAQWVPMTHRPQVQYLPNGLPYQV